MHITIAQECFHTKRLMKNPSHLFLENTIYIPEKVWNVGNAQIVVFGTFIFCSDIAYVLISTIGLYLQLWQNVV